MDAWLGAHLPWLTGPWGWGLLLVVTLVPPSMERFELNNHLLK